MRKAFIQLHTAVFLAGFTGILGRLITLNEGLLVWYRLMITAVTMWIVFFLAKRIHAVSTADKLKIAGTGFIAAMHWVSFYGAIKYANVSVALVCFSSVGFFTALLEPLFLKRRFVPAQLLLGLLAMAGIYIIFHFDAHYKTGIIIDERFNGGGLLADLSYLFSAICRVWIWCLVRSRATASNSGAAASFPQLSMNDM